MKTGKLKLALLVFVLSAYAFSSACAETTMGISLGENMHWNDGGLYNAHGITIQCDYSAENFGIIPFFTFSFTVNKGSELKDNVVSYNYTLTSFVESIGVKPYYMFRKTENSTSYVGIIFSLGFIQDDCTVTSTPTNVILWKDSYMYSGLGLFLGNRWNVSDKMIIFTECDLASRLFTSCLTYEYSQKEVEHYQNEMFGGGGTRSWSVNITPRLGIAYRL